MVKMTRVKTEVNADNVMVVGVDVDKEKFHAYTEFHEGGEVTSCEDTVGNRHKQIQTFLAEWSLLAQQHGRERLLVAVEPTGGFEKLLLEMARRAGHLVCYVSGEATSKSKVIESNDASKTDPKDARIVYRLALQRRTLVVRKLPDAYAQMRFLHATYDSEEVRGASIKNEFLALLHRQFPDLSLTNKQLFDDLGMALAELFYFCPQRMVADGYDRFSDRMHEYMGSRDRRVAKKTLETIYRQAELSSAFLEMMEILELRGEQLLGLLSQYRACRQRLEEIKEELVRLFRQTPEHEKLAQLPKVSEAQLARLIAETGPLGDFASHAQLMRYLGMNLRVRQSGFYKGKTKLSKKGRSLGRKVLYQLVLYFMVGKGRLYYEYYHEKLEQNRSHADAMTATMRKALKMIWGVCRSATGFRPERVHNPLLTAAAA